MKAKAKGATAQISNDLHEHILTKDTVSFWKTRKTRLINGVPLLVLLMDVLMLLTLLTSLQLTFSRHVCQIIHIAVNF